MRSHCKLGLGIARHVKGELQNFRGIFSPSAYPKSAEQRGRDICPHRLGEASVGLPSTSGQPDVQCEHEREASPANSLPPHAGAWGPLAAAPFLLLRGHRAVRSHFMQELQMSSNILGMVDSGKKLHLVSTQAMLKSE